MMHKIQVTKSWMGKQIIKAHTKLYTRINGDFAEMTGKTWIFVAIVGLVFFFGPKIYTLVFGGVSSSLSTTSSNFGNLQDYAG